MPRHEFHKPEGVEERKCACGAIYYVDESTKWKTMCLDCWKKKKREQEAYAEQARQRYQKEAEEREAKRRQQQSKTGDEYKERFRERQEREKRFRDEFFRNAGEDFFRGFDGFYGGFRDHSQERTRSSHEKRPQGSKLEMELKENIRVLIQLCHPDKHNGSDASKRITQWLLEIKSRM